MGQTRYQSIITYSPKCNLLTPLAGFFGTARNVSLTFNENGAPILFAELENPENEGDYIESELDLSECIHNRKGELHCK